MSYRWQADNSKTLRSPSAAGAKQGQTEFIMMDKQLWCKLMGRRLTLIAMLAIVPIVALSPSRFASAQTIGHKQGIQSQSCPFCTVLAGTLTWNERAANAGNFKIFVVGDSPISERLEKIAAKRQVNGRALKVKTIDTSADIPDCHILFISKEVPDDEVSRLTERAGR